MLLNESSKPSAIRIVLKKSNDQCNLNLLPCVKGREEFMIHIGATIANFSSSKTDQNDEAVRNFKNFLGLSLDIVRKCYYY